MNAGTNINVSQLLNAPVRRPPDKEGHTQKRENKEMEAFKDAAKG